MKNNYRILKIDACADSKNSWTWNNCYHTSTYYESEYGLLNKESAIKCLADKLSTTKEELLAECCLYDDEYNLVLVRTKDNMPIYAIEYKEV